jgi:hypothetical protein
MDKGKDHLSLLLGAEKASESIIVTVVSFEIVSLALIRTKSSFEEYMKRYSVEDPSKD